MNFFYLIQYTLAKMKVAVSIFFIGVLISACGDNPYKEAINIALLAKNPLLITGSETMRPNSAGGVNVSLSAINLSSNTIKYITFTVNSYNAVGDVVDGEVNNNSIARLQDTGPIAFMGKMSGEWSTVWYNSTITCMEISHIKIEYLNGKSITIASENKINDLLRYDVQNNCSIG